MNFKVDFATYWKIQWNKNTSIFLIFTQPTHKKHHISKRIMVTFLNFLIIFSRIKFHLTETFNYNYKMGNLYPFPIHSIFSPFISDFNGKIKYTQKNSIRPFFLYTPWKRKHERMKFKGIFSACLILVTWSSQKRRERKMLEKTFLKSKEFSFLHAVFYFLGTLQQWQNQKIVLWEIELLSLRQPRKFFSCYLQWFLLLWNQMN